MAAPTLVAFSFVNTANATGVNITIPDTLTWQTNDVVVALCGDEGGSTVTANAISTTGSGLTFTRNQNLFANGTFCSAAVFTAVATAGSSGTVSFQETYGGGATTNKFLGVYIFRGSNGVGNSTITSTPGTTATISLTPTAADGSIAWAVFDFSAAAAAGDTPTATSHGTSTPGPKASPQNTLVGTAYTYYCADLDDQTSAGAVSYGTTASGGKYTIVAIEVKAGTGAATSSPLPYVAAPAFRDLQGPKFQPRISYEWTGVQTSGDASPAADVTNVNVTANNPTVQVTGLPDTPSVTAAANGPTPAVTGTPPAASVTVAALNPSVSVTAFPGVASVAVAAPNPTVTVAASPGVGAVTVSALSPSVTVRAAPGSANVTVAGQQPTPAVTAFPTTAPVNVAAYNPSITTSGGITANAGVANVTVAANNPASSIAFTAGTAGTTVAASSPTPAVAGSAARGAVTAAAYQPGVSTIAVPFTVGHLTANDAIQNYVQPGEGLVYGPPYHFGTPYGAGNYGDGVYSPAPLVYGAIPGTPTGATQSTLTASDAPDANPGKTFAYSAYGAASYGHGDYGGDIVVDPGAGVRPDSAQNTLTGGTMTYQADRAT